MHLRVYICVCMCIKVLFPASNHASINYISCKNAYDHFVGDVHDDEISNYTHTHV